MKIDEKMTIIGAFTKFLADIGMSGMADAGKKEVDQFARRLIADGRNSLENFTFLRDHADKLGHRTLFVVLTELMDCHNAIEVLADEIEARHGKAVRERIFQEAFPPLGADEKERCAYTKAITERMARQLAPEEARTAWFQVQHGIPAAAWLQSDQTDKVKYMQCGSIDAFLDLKRRERDAMLKRLRDENRLWYTIVIDDEVLDFIRSDPEMEGGRREGDRIFITKVPYNAIAYLHASDAVMKRYYACHCPLVREAILQDRPISPDVCNCSLGHASHYVAGLGLALRGEVLECAVKGDTRCRFVFYLPTTDVEPQSPGASPPPAE